MTDEVVGDEVYDVIVVGAGFAGATVAKTIAAAPGPPKRILLLEAGRSTGMSADKYRSQVEAFQATLAKVPNSPYPNNPNAPQADVLDLEPVTAMKPSTKGYLVQTGPLPFASDWVRALGGTSLHWLGTSLRMLPNDFQLQTKYGYGLDWPIGYDDLGKYYQKAERDIIGVAGSVAEQHYPGIDPKAYWKDFEHEGDGYRAYEYPMEALPPSYLDQVMSRRFNEHGGTIEVNGTTHEVRLSNTPAGRNSTPRGDYKVVGAVGNPLQGQRCEGNTNCIPICPVQAKYNSLKTLYELMMLHPEKVRTPGKSSVKIVSQAVASKLTIDDQGRISGVVYQEYDDEMRPPSTTAKTARARVYVLAAHAIENAKLLLASRTDSFPEGAANSSGLVGRNLMDHPLILTWGLMPEKVWGFRGPLSTSGIEPFRDGPFRGDPTKKGIGPKAHCAFRIEVGNEGWSFSSGAPYSTVDALVYGGPTGGERLFGSQLRQKVGEVIPRQFRLALEMEQIAESSNRVTIDPAYRDAMGNYRPVITYDLPDYVREGMKVAADASDKMYQLLGVPKLTSERDRNSLTFPGEYTQYNTTDAGHLEYEGKSYTFFGAGHVAGTHVMGSTPANSVVDRNQRSWDHQNLYMVGCGNMPTVGTSNPTLTMTALAIWAGENIVKALAGDGR